MLVEALRSCSDFPHKPSGRRFESDQPPDIAESAACDVYTDERDASASGLLLALPIGQCRCVNARCLGAGVPGCKRGEDFPYVFKPSPAGDGPDCAGRHARPCLPLRSRAAARLWAAGHAPATGS
jgi:hypothetical protein